MRHGKGCPQSSTQVSIQVRYSADPACSRPGSRCAAWTESRHFYTAKELAALELTEAITVLTDGFVPDAVYARAASEFDETELVYLIAAITTGYQRPE